MVAYTRHTDFRQQPGSWTHGTAHWVPQQVMSGGGVVQQSPTGDAPHSAGSACVPKGGSRVQVQRLILSLQPSSLPSIPSLHLLSYLLLCLAPIPVLTTPSYALGMEQQRLLATFCPHFHFRPALVPNNTLGANQQYHPDDCCTPISGNTRHEIHKWGVKLIAADIVWRK